ncbi:MAG: thioesterase domain-containing protein [Myxococcales bacterium]|nr:thioesterase domain-containing protein [Myxococcales bacterium]
MTSEDRTGCLRNMKKRQKPRLQLLCFAHAGASAEAYRAWLNHLPDDVELWAVEPPGRAFRCTEAPWRTMQGLVEEVGSSVAEVASRPFMMFGHSLGALQAFETVRWLRERKLPLPQQLCVSAFRGPHLSSRTAGMSALPDQEFVNELIVRYGGANHVLEDPDLRAVALPALRSDFELLESYAYQPAAPAPCPIMAFGGNADAVVSPEELAGWAMHTQDSFALSLRDGDHFYVEQHFMDMIKAMLSAERRQYKN